jgi:hypothetical protein
MVDQLAPDRACPDDVGVPREAEETRLAGLDHEAAAGVEVVHH